ncbi:GNAT family N-acetyltransferase [Actinomadura sp. LCR2-06]|uniref:GNAT family N-acetyltransferase n=2 Tax=Actinomadura violacea TaxID=2819934 RepID=A0ABS3S8H2_9ACTN|nr:GNAT family N-acetyltransferase [Actinomadura violacea]
MGFMKQLNVRSVAHIAAPEDVRIRPYGVTDRERLVRMSGRLSGASLYTRFFSGTPRIPDYYVATMDRLDHWDREALVALADGEMVGIAEYVRDVRVPCRAELAVLVADPWQRRGLGSRLVGYLTQLAARRGITEFGADVILGNRDALLFVRHGWPAARSRTEEGAAHFHLPLPPPRPAARS